MHLPNEIVSQSLLICPFVSVLKSGRLDTITSLITLSYFEMIQRGYDAQMITKPTILVSKLWKAIFSGCTWNNAFQHILLTRYVTKSVKVIRGVYELHWGNLHSKFLKFKILLSCILILEPFFAMMHKCSQLPNNKHGRKTMDFQFSQTS